MADSEELSVAGSYFTKTIIKPMVKVTRRQEVKSKKEEATPMALLSLQILVREVKMSTTKVFTMVS